jgi:hypothetical protein
MKIFRELTWPEGTKVIACDFDHAGRLAALVHAPPDRPRAELDGIVHTLPPWAARASRIAWLDKSEALLWPVDLHVGRGPRIGKIGPNGTNILDLEYPLEMFSDRNLIAFTYSEERIDNHTNIISIFSSFELKKVACLTDDFVDTLKEPSLRLLEVEHGVLDASAQRFWFSGYPSEYLWCFSINNPQIRVCKLGCSRDEIRAITCRGDQAAIIVRRNNSFGICTYKHLDDRVTFEAQTEISTNHGAWREITERLNQPSGCLRGHADNMIALTTETSALFAEISVR